MSAATDLKGTVLALLREAAEATLGENRPDLVVGFDVSRDSRATLGWARRYAAAVEAALPAAETDHAEAVAEYEATVRAAMAANLNDLRVTGDARVSQLLGSRHLPKDLRRWATRQLQRARDAHNRWGVAYVYLMLRSAFEWEVSHLPEYEAQDALSVEQRRWVAKHCADEGREVTYYNDEGDLVTVRNVSDSPSRELDKRGWDRPSSIGRRVGPKKKARTFRQAFIDRATKREFELTNKGWFYNQVRVSTEIAQRLDERVASGRLVKVVDESAKARRAKARVAA